MKGKKHITHLISRPVSSQNPSIISGEIKLLFQSLGFTPRKVQLNIPRHMATARFLRIPSVDDNEISKIIKIESIKHLPYTDEKVIYGYKVIEKLEDGYSKILLVMAQADTINNLIQIIKLSDIKELKSISLSSEALFLWYMLIRGDAKNENVVLVNLDLSHLDIDIMESGNLIFTRGFAYSINDPRKLLKIVDQVKISINTCQKESAKAVNRIVLTGGEPDASNIRDALTKELKIPVDVVTNINNAQIDENIKTPNPEVSFAELIGLLLKSEETEINLLPEDIQEEARLISIKNNLITATLLTAICFTMGLGLFVKKMHDKDVYLAALNAQMKKVKPRVTAVKKMLKDVSIIREIMSMKPLAIDIVSEVYEVTPANFSLNMIEFESGKSLTIRGSSPSLSDMLKYVAALEKSPFFENVKVKYANKRMVENKEMADFEINAAITVFK